MLSCSPVCQFIFWVPSIHILMMPSSLILRQFIFLWAPSMLIMKSIPLLRSKLIQTPIIPRY
ncbi:hypothetical protein C0J52_16723 [Blattella germanica]|nr:hypothetical protein C0J52_16723 [Blattella germanica]